MSDNFSSDGYENAAEINHSFNGSQMVVRNNKHSAIVEDFGISSVDNHLEKDRKSLVSMHQIPKETIPSLDNYRFEDR